MDRLSELPDSVIFQIFWLLPIIDVVRTTILSKRWKNLWTTTPSFNITDYYIWNFDTIKKVPNIVHRALLRWDGVKVLKFKVKMRHGCSVNGDTDLWVRFAQRHEVEELYLHSEDFHIKTLGHNDDEAHWVPQYLYSCSSLKVLLINTYYFRRINGNVQWNQLKSLTIINGLGVNEDMINQILCGSPQLEVLIMSFVVRVQSLSIRSTSLKKLSIYKYLYYAEDASTYTELRIWAPNLQTLEIKGIPYNKCLLMNVSSLTHATLGYSYVHRIAETYCEGLSTNQYLGDLFGQILPSIQHVENVTLLSCCVKVLRAMIEGCMNSSHPNVKSLRLRFMIQEDPSLSDNAVLRSLQLEFRITKFLGMIEIFPLLKKLFIKVGERVPSYDYQDSLETDSNIYLQFEENLPMSFVLEVRTVEVTLVEGDILFPFLEFLLKNASKLEKIVFRVKGSQNCLLRASHKLLKMPRSSRTAVFSFCEY